MNYIHAFNTYEVCIAGPAQGTPRIYHTLQHFGKSLGRYLLFTSGRPTRPRATDGPPGDPTIEENQLFAPLSSFWFASVFELRFRHRFL